MPMVDTCILAKNAKSCQKILEKWPALDDIKAKPSKCEVVTLIEVVIGYLKMKEFRIHPLVKAQ